MLKLGDVVTSADSFGLVTQGDYKYICDIREENGIQKWITVSGLGGCYGGPPSHWKKVPSGTETWCDRNQYNDPD